MPQNQIYQLSLTVGRVSTGGSNTRIGRMAVFGIKSGIPIKTNNIGSLLSDPQDIAQYGANAVKLASFDLSDVQGYLLKTAPVISSGFSIGAIIITRDIGGPAGVMYVSLDDVSLVPANPSSCLLTPPLKGMATNVTTNSAVIKWQRVLNATNYSYEVRTDKAAGSGAIGLLTSGTTADTFFNLNLGGSGRFQVFVKANCTDGGTSTWSNPISFSTPEFPCNQGALTTLNENFEGAITGSLPPCWRNSIYRSFWNLEANVDIRQSSRGTLGNASRRMIMYRTTTVDSTLIMAILPEMSNIGAGTHRLRFKAANSSTSAGRVQIGTLSNVFDPSTFTPIGAPTTILDNTFREYTVNFANYRGNNRNIAFKYIEGGGDGDFQSIEIDDVIWEATGVNPCTTDTQAPVFANCPTNINLTTTGTTAIANWTPPTATDNCSTPSVSSTHNSGFAFPIGTTTVVYTAKDALNNTATCSFNVIVSTTQLCGKPVNGMVISVTTTAALVKWQRVPNTTNYSYEVRTGNVAGSGTAGLVTSGIATDTFFNFSGSGRFQIFVRANCNGGGASQWSNPILFTSLETACNQGALTALSENFEGTTIGFLPTCWRPSVFRNKASLEANVAVSQTSHGTLNNTSNRMVMYRTASSDSAIIMSILPEMSNIGAGTQRLRFKAANAGTTSIGRVQIGTLSNIFDPTTFTPIGAQTMILDNTFREYTVNFANYRGSDRHIAFKYVAGGFDGNFFSIEIDDVIWEQSTGGTGNDIGLTITSTPTTYRQWTPITVRVSAKNNGTTAMTNIKIDLKRPAKTSSGGTKTPSVGTFRDYCSAGVECSEWTIPSLAAGATATLDAPFFVLDATLPIVVTTNLLASTPSDAVVSNNTATVSIAPTVAAAPSPALLSYQKPTQLIPIVVQRIAPNPTEGALIVKLESLDAREVTFDFFNVFGQLVKSEKRAVEKGMNRVEFDVYELEQGVHFIIPSTTKGHKVPTKFVKM